MLISVYFPPRTRRDNTRGVDQVKKSFQKVKLKLHMQLNIFFSNFVKNKIKKNSIKLFKSFFLFMYWKFSPVF